MEQPGAFAALKAEKPAKSRFLQPEKIFEISSVLSRMVPVQEDRETLFRRLRNYAYTKRRGRLRLPAYFSAKVRALSDLTKSQIRDMLYWVKPSTGLAFPLRKREHQRVVQLSAVPIWNRRSASDCHTAHSVGLYRLSKRDVPSTRRALWPSAPSFTEMLEMSRRGVSPLSVHASPRYSVKNGITRRDLSDNIRLATRIVASQIVGIRSSVEIPEAWLRWFRYRYGFSILSVRYKLPSGLVRFLLAQWIKCPSNLWLLDHCPLRVYLRKHTADEFLRCHELVAGDSAATHCVGHCGSGVGNPSTIDCTVTYLYGLVAEPGTDCPGRLVHPYGWTSQGGYHLGPGRNQRLRAGYA